MSMKRSLSERICRRLEMTVSAYRQDCRFSARFALYRMIDDLTWRAGLKRISTYFHEKKDRYIQDYLEKLLQPVIERYVDDHELGERVDNAPIWVCWWNGEDAAPPLVRQCIQSIRKQAGDHPVHLITEQTFSEYLEIPQYILKHLQNKKLCLANFSDYLRFSLLEKYGGIWLDATVFCSASIHQGFFESPVFSCKTECERSRYISNCRWTSFCFAGWKRNVLFRFFREAWEYYWQCCDQAIDYLLVDYLIDIACLKLGCVSESIASIPENNLHRDDLQAAMNAALPAEAFESVLREDTTLYKLSWRETYSMETEDGRPSVYAHFLKMVI